MVNPVVESPHRELEPDELLPMKPVANRLYASLKGIKKMNQKWRIKTWKIKRQKQKIGLGYCVTSEFSPLPDSNFW